MIEHAERATVYRQRASQLRAMALGLRNEWTRETFLRLAQNYDSFADTHEQLATVKR